MKRMMAVVLATVIVAAGLALAVSPARAQDAVCPDGPTQGALALAMAQLIWGAEGPQTESDAIQRLQDAGVAPQGGWRPNACAEPVKAELETLVADAVRLGKLPAGTPLSVVATAFDAVRDAYRVLNPGSGDPLSNKKASASPSSPAGQ